MKIRNVIQIVCFAVNVYSQSGGSYAPPGMQPRVLIPHVEPPETIVSNGVVVANPYRHLKYCDFVLKATEQTVYGGEMVYVYCSTEKLSQSFADKNAAVYYLNPAVSGISRIQHFHSDGVGQKLSPILHYEFFYTPWAYIIDRYDMNRCRFYGDYQAPPQITVENPSRGLSVTLDKVTTTNQPAGMQHYYANTSAGATLGLARWSGNGNAYGIFSGEWRFHSPQTGAIVFVWRGGAPNDGLPDGYTMRGTEMDNDVLITTNGWEYIDVPHTGVGSIQGASENRAQAIEVFPSIKGFGRWMYQGNENIKWMCLLSNGIDFYRDSVSGEPVFFDVWVEWVGGAPKLLK